MKFKYVIIFIIFSIILSILVGYSNARLNVIDGRDCDSLNSSISQYSCNAAKNPLSNDGIEYYLMWLSFSPLIGIQAAQVFLLGMIFYIIISNKTDA